MEGRGGKVDFFGYSFRLESFRLLNMSRKIHMCVIYRQILLDTLKNSNSVSQIFSCLCMLETHPSLAPNLPQVHNALDTTCASYSIIL